MARRVFYSFHYKPDNWRAAQVRNIGTVEGNRPATDNEWETVKRGGDAAIRRWIDGQLSGKSCALVLIGEDTAGRKWIDYEIETAWNSKKGVVGVHIHNLKNILGNKAKKGRNPFETFTLGTSRTRLSTVVKAYDPPFSASKDVYDYIARNLVKWVEEAVAIRNRY